MYVFTVSCCEEVRNISEREMLTLTKQLVGEVGGIIVGDVVSSWFSR